MAKVTLTAASSQVVCSNVTPIGEQDTGTKHYCIRNVTGTVDVFLEGNGVAAVATSYQWKTSDPIPLYIDLEPGERLEGIVNTAGANQVVTILQLGR